MVKCQAPKRPRAQLAHFPLARLWHSIGFGHDFLTALVVQSEKKPRKLHPKPMIHSSIAPSLISIEDVSNQYHKHRPLNKLTHCWNLSKGWATRVDGESPAGPAWPCCNTRSMGLATIRAGILPHGRPHGLPNPRMRFSSPSARVSARWAGPGRCRTRPVTFPWAPLRSSSSFTDGQAP